MVIKDGYISCWFLNHKLGLKSLFWQLISIKLVDRNKCKTKII